MNKICLVTDATDGGLYILLRGVHEWTKRHDGDIQVALLEKAGDSFLKDLEDGDTLYLVGHASVDSIRDKKAEAIWPLLLKAGLPKTHFTMVFMGCNTGNYASKKRKDDPHLTDKYEPTEVLAKQLKKLFRNHGYTGITFRCPKRPSFVLSAKEGDGANSDNLMDAKSFEALFKEDDKKALQKVAHLWRAGVDFSLLAYFLINWGPYADRNKEFEALNTAAQEHIFKNNKITDKDIKDIAKKITENEKYKEFNKQFMGLVIKYKLCFYPLDSGWITLTT